ncbi:hypothetical protein SNE26_27080 [Mucilaginibacter sp. cycad4]|uniref:hypothetical protein n=1 Tax=Mucilaginibacter sp. cycad4 TaxID=3342096 RepID=UPI002AAB2B4E|nr:hypothetical protein [Mucilaginibacter gossypii]WPU99685.1 hypothetical protein SNE26_27080 [Mucilaginibacter gossypii]
MKFAPLQPLQTGAVVHTKGRKIGVEKEKRRKINTPKLLENKKSKKILERRKGFLPLQPQAGKKFKSF